MGSRLDEAKLKKKVLLGYLSSLDTVVPALAGFTLVMGKIFFGIESGLFLFLGLVSLLGAAGMFLTRMILGSDKIERAAIEEMQEEVRAEREKSLKDLDRRLRRDDDPRTEKLLKDLIVLMEAFKEESGWATKINAKTTVDLLIRVEELFKGCEQSLRSSLELWETAQKVSTEAARKPILEERERIVTDIEESLVHLSKVLTEIQGVGASRKDRDSDLARIRREMDECLAVAERVEERMKSWDTSSRVLE